MMATAQSPSIPAKIRALVGAIAKRISQSRIVRVITHYTNVRGPILAAGLAYQAVFASFAALWIVFSITGLVLSGDVGLRDALIESIAQAVPGLIDTGNGGAIDPEVLLSAGALSLSAGVAIAGLLFTALNWLDSSRLAVRALFGLPKPRTNIFLLKAGDIAAGLVLGVALLLSLALTVAATQATTWLLGLVHLDNSGSAFIAGRAATLLVLLLVNAGMLAGLYRLLAGIKIPWRILRNGVLIGTVGVSALQIAGGALIGGATSNPLIASFAVIAGLLIWFNLSCHVILLAASWISVEVRDRDLVLDPHYEQRRLEEARELVAKYATPEEPKHRSLLDRILGR
jgi:membrane protein